MPRITKRSKLNRQPADCDTCGKHCEKPYGYQIVPVYMNELDIPPYSKSAKKIKRLDLEGYRKVTTFNYCSEKCRDIRWKIN
tara:strand:- start:490 stop:735 length:246 start_codon:yes stop_codon:yes gene_type:complete